MTPDGNLTTIHSFCSQYNCADGANPLAGLVQGRDGGFDGAAPVAGDYGGGTVFSFNRDGKLTTLHSFCVQSGCPDGTYPTSTLVEGPDGGFFGTTEWGGANATCPGDPALPATCGTVFKITPEGVLSALHSLDGADGANPYGGLVHAANNEFYGATVAGGDSNNGTVFKVSPSGAFTTLASFNGTNGAGPSSALIQANDGPLYGTTGQGGTSGDGTLFKITMDGADFALQLRRHKRPLPPGGSDARHKRKILRNNFRRRGQRPMPRRLRHDLRVFGGPRPVRRASTHAR
jgi:uncharacterized repeat protein (TIGR03803 family)